MIGSGKCFSQMFVFMRVCYYYIATDAYMLAKSGPSSAAFSSASLNGGGGIVDKGSAAGPAG